MSSAINASWVTTGISDSYSFTLNVNFIKYLSEAELREIISKLIERNIPEADLRIACTLFVECHHVSEQFLLDYDEYISYSSAMNLHASDILSGEYSAYKIKHMNL